jgi:hypothetical protein
MNSKHQRVELNGGHIAPVLGFSTYILEEVTEMLLVLRVQKKM